MHYAAGYLTTKYIHTSICGKVSCTANGILVVSKQEPNSPLLTKHQAALWKRHNPLARLALEKQGGETNTNLRALPGLGHIQIKSLHHEKERGIENKIREKWGDEKEMRRLRGWVRLRHKNRYRMWRRETWEETEIIPNLSECVCVFVWVCVRVCERTARLCFTAYVTRLTVFVSLRVIVCHSLCE